MRKLLGTAAGCYIVMISSMSTKGRYMQNIFKCHESQLCLFLMLFSENTNLMIP